MPDAQLFNDLANLIIQDNAVFFIDASLTTAPSPQERLTKMIANALLLQLEIPYSGDQENLFDVAQDFESKYGRHRLCEVIIDKVQSLPRKPTAAYQHLAAIAQPGTKIISAQFDTGLEKALDNLNKSYKVINDDLLSLFDETFITLVKLQGDINRIENLRITTEDIAVFDEEYRNLNELLRSWFKTKSLIYLGDNFPNHSPFFSSLYYKMRRAVKGLERRTYVIVSAGTARGGEGYWSKQNVKVLEPDLTAALQLLRQSVQAKAGILELEPIIPILSYKPDHPYKELVSFLPLDATIFAGRVDESERLKHRIQANTLTVLYGESGSGKTSLFQAGTGYLLTKDQLLWTICTPIPGQPLLTLMRNNLIETAQETKLSSPDDGDLATLIKKWSHELGDKPVIVAIDQFEQFFEAYSPTEREEAISSLGQLLYECKLNLSLVLIIRQDFLGRLESLNAHLPGLLDVRFRLERLDRASARSAIEEPVKTFKVTWKPILVEKLLDELDSGGIAPPQLQIVCDYLYRTFAEPFLNEAKDKNQKVELKVSHFEEAGGTKAILGQYLQRAMAEFNPDEQAKVRLILKELTSSKGLKQRLPLPQIIRSLGLEATAAIQILDKLTARRLLQRYEQPELAYELTHDYLAAQIYEWLSETEQQQKQVRELVDLALQDWQDRQRLLPPDDLRRVKAQRAFLDFSTEALVMIYAAAVSYNDDPAGWQHLLLETTRRSILLALLKHTEPSARSGAANQLVHFLDPEVVAPLTKQSYSDPEVTVRQAATEAIVKLIHLNPEVGQAAVNILLSEINSGNQLARESLVTIRDFAPVCHHFIPKQLQGTIQRQIWFKRRLPRHRQDILNSTLRGIQGGFIGLGLGFGLYFGMQGGSNTNLQFVFFRIFFGLVLGGFMGAVIAGGSTFVGNTLRSLQDYAQSISIAIVSTLTGAILTSMGFGLLSIITPGTTVMAPMAGFFIGVGLVGSAIIPLPLTRFWRLMLCLLLNTGIFVFVGILEWFFVKNYFLLTAIGIISAAGFFWGLNSKIIQSEEVL